MMPERIAKKIASKVGDKQGERAGVGAGAAFIDGRGGVDDDVNGCKTALHIR